MCGFEDTDERLRRNPKSFFIYLPSYGILEKQELFKVKHGKESECSHARSRYRKTFSGS